MNFYLLFVHSLNKFGIFWPSFEWTDTIVFYYLKIKKTEFNVQQRSQLKRLENDKVLKPIHHPEYSSTQLV